MATKKQKYLYTECRAMGHEWHHWPKPLTEGIATGMVGLVSTCSACGMERTKWIARSGALQPPSYRQPDGYRTSGEARRTLQTWRSDFVADLFPKGRRK